MTEDNTVARWEADGVAEHILVFEATTASSNGAYMYPTKLTLTPIDSGSFTTVVKDAAHCNGSVTLQANAALQEDVTANAASVPSVTIPEGVTLDLNGKKLAADVIGQGKLTDSSAAAGVVISSNAPTCGVNANELLLKTETGYQIFDYTLESADVEKAEDGKSVNFWFDVRFAEAQATAAYTAIAAGNSGFGLTAQLSWDNGTPLTAQFGEGKSVQDWASLMLQDPDYSFYIRVTGLDSVTTAGTLKAAPQIVGLQGSTTISGGSGADNTKLDEAVSASLFVYDVEAMKVIACMEIEDAIAGLKNPVSFVDVIEADPEVPGKFWGIVSDTLFSYTFDMDTKTFAVKEELSFGKSTYNHGGSG